MYRSNSVFFTWELWEFSEFSCHFQEIYNKSHLTDDYFKVSAFEY